jgi:hypothetical protein
VVLGLAAALGLGAGTYRASHRTGARDAPPVEDLIDASARLARALPIGALDADVRAGDFGAAHVHVALFASGRAAGSAWGASERVEPALALAYQAARRRRGADPTAAVVSVAIDQEQITSRNRRAKLSNVHRGVYGLSIRAGGGGTQRLILRSPTEVVATNRPHERHLERYADEQGVTVEDLIAGRRVSVFTARQFYVDLRGGRPGQELLRGNVLIRPEEVTHEALRAFARRMSEWMVGSVQADGRMVYLYWPSRGEESKNNNTIRQWMATICLGRIARAGELPGAREAADRNLRYNLRTFYRERGGLGSIEYDGSSKLGAMALALVAIMESPLRPRLQAEEAALRRAIDHLWQPSGAFRTFLFPPQRNDNHNFYPGEALLAWAMSYAERPSVELDRKIMTSYAYYRRWHLANRNPAFVPWHTQAYFILWRTTGRPELASWTLDMNDWLLGMQERSMVAYEDTRGRFYDPGRPHYGPPHASSTGAYLEGLIDAFALARRLGDAPRAGAYRRSILLGLRDAMQLEFADDIDLFYVAQRGRVRGGLRTTVYDNSIRVDNVQHVLMALQKVLRVFQPDDYRL